MKTLYLIILFLIITSWSYSQTIINKDFNYRAFYSYTFQTDSNDVKSKKTDRTILLGNDSIALFESYNRYLRDSVEYDNYKKSGQRDLSLAQVMQYISDYNDKLMIDKESSILMHTNNNMFKCQYPMKVHIEWEIIDDTMYIENEICQKAVCNYGNRQWIAWFAPEIPINNGPYVFQGLPGIIMKIYDTQEYFVWNLLYYKNEKITYASLAENSEHLITQKDFFEYRSKPHNFFEGSSMKRVKPLSLSEQKESRKSDERSFLKNNNHIERM